MRVVLFTEGTYPFVRGGVSTWCQHLIAGLSDVSFDVYAVIGTPEGRTEYTLPANVRKLIPLAMWGIESLHEYNRPFLPARAKRSSAALRAEFLPLFRDFLHNVAYGMESSDPKALGEILAALYLYFRVHDYDWTMRQDDTWKAALEFLCEQAWHARFMTMLEAIEIVRTLYRYLMPLAIELPDADVYHASVSGLASVPSIIAKYALHKPVLLTEHGVYLRERILALARGGFPLSDRTIKKNLFSAFARASYQASDIIAPVCSYNTRWESFYGVASDRLHVVYNGVDGTMFSDQDYWPARPTVVSVARIDPLKDILTLIAASAELRKLVPGVAVEVWGPSPDPDYRRECERLIDEFSLRDTVALRGPTEDPAAAYAHSHVAVLSSISEGFPFSVIEALMCAKPVVATDVGGVREAVGDSGTIVPPRRPDRLAEALAVFLKDPELARTTGKRGRAFAVENFDRSVFLGRYRQLYHMLAGGSREVLHAG
jgi:glycosyltransferase involved in cell wall biosynthesis